MDWIDINDHLPELNYVIDNPNHGRCRYSSNCLIATKNGGIYIGYYGSDTIKCPKKTIRGWYTASVQDEGIDTDGVRILKVIAWQELPPIPSSEN